MADVAATLRLWSATAGNNAPQGSTAVGTGLDDNLREIQKVVRQFLAAQSADIASAGTTDLSTATGFFVNITGVTTITSFGTEDAGIHYLLKFASALTLTHNATSLILPGGVNLTTAAGDQAWVKSEGSGNWRVLTYLRAALDPTQPLPAPSGTRMLFQQTSAPTGWTKETSATYNDAALRLQTGTVTTGGADAFSTHFGTSKSTASHTLVIGEIPAHTHTQANDTGGDGAGAGNPQNAANTSGTTATGSAGGGGGHSHTLNSFDIKFADCIIAQKD